MSALKVAQINCTASGGSTGKITEQLSRKMAENGLDSIILSSGYKEQKLSGHTFFISGTPGVRLHQLVGILFGDSGFHSMFATLKAIRILKQYSPDVVHIHNLHGYYLHIGMLFRYLKKSGVPVVWTVHDCWMFTGHCTHYAYVGCDRWLDGCGNCPQRKQYPYSLFFDRSRQLWAAKKKLSEGWKKLSIVTVSDWLKGEIEKSFWNRCSIRRIYNGIDRKNYYPEERDNVRQLLGIPSDTLIILGVAATWNSRKGLDDFKTLAGMLSQDERILLIGVTDRQKAEMPNNITAISHIWYAPLLRQYYNAADIFVSFSYEETMGMAAVEAMACGTPALVYDSTASPELVHEGCGYVIKSGDVSAALSAIRSAKKLTKAHFSAACQQAVSETFDQQDRYQEYCELYREISGNGGEIE